MKEEFNEEIKIMYKNQSHVGNKKHSCFAVLHREDYSDTALNQYKAFISQPVTTLGNWDPVYP